MTWSLVLLSLAIHATDRPNVLFIAIDDLRADLDSLGRDHQTTPHLDQLASEGFHFTRHYVQVPTCGASRYALLTGRSPTKSGVVGGNNALYRGPSALSREPDQGARSMPELFRQHGYRTVLIGKISHTPDGRVFAYDGKGDGRSELPGAWDVFATPYGSWRRGWGAFFAYGGGLHREDGRGHRALMEFDVEDDSLLPDGLMAERACLELADLAERDEPFFMGLGFFKPHLPFVATRADWEALSTVEVLPPPSPQGSSSSYGSRSGEFYGYKAPYEKTRPLSAEATLLARRSYLACVRYVDRQVGRVLEALHELDLARNTIVVVWGDHGWHLGDSALWGKHTPFERALHSPLIVRVPDDSPTRRIDALVQTLDIYPTLVELCSLEDHAPSHSLDGLSLVPLMRGQRTRLHESVQSFWGKTRSLRSESHRLIATLDEKGPREVELYDMRESPDPLHDIAASHPELLNELLSRIR